MRKFLLATAFAFSLPLASSLAGTEAPPAPNRFCYGSADAFAKGSLSFENVTGLYYFFDRGDNDGATLDFTVSSLRLGVMLSDPHGAGFLRVTLSSSPTSSGAGFFRAPGMSSRGAP